jgi:hypothetical protein
MVRNGQTYRGTRGASVLGARFVAVGRIPYGVLHVPFWQRLEQQSLWLVHGWRSGTQAWQVPEPPSPRMQWLEQHWLLLVQIAPIARQAVPHTFPPSVERHWPEQQSPSPEQDCPSMMQATQAPPAHRPEQHWAPLVHVVGLPVAMHEAQAPRSQTRPLQHGWPPSAAQAPPGPWQLWHCPPEQMPLQHSAGTVQPPAALHGWQVLLAPTVMQEPSQQAPGSWAQLWLRGMQVAQRPFKQRPEQQSPESAQGPPSGDPTQIAGPQTKPPSPAVQLPEQQSALAVQVEPSATQVPQRKPVKIPPSSAGAVLGVHTRLQQSAGVAQGAPSLLQRHPPSGLAP